MMADVAENQPPALPPGPSGPSGSDDPTPPRGLERAMDAEEYRRFQEFQRFQDYQRFVQAQEHSPNGNVPAPVQPQQQALHTQLEGMRQQLARIERVTNPPLWQKILRNKWLHRAAWLVIVIALAVWGVPMLIGHYFGNSNDNPGGQAALHPGTVQGSGKLYTNPKDAVAELYHVIEGGPPGNSIACEIFTSSGAEQFTRDLGAGNCVAAINKIYAQLGQNGVAAYSTVSIPDTALTQAGSGAQISSCAMQIDAGPRLGLFLLTQNSQLEWQVTGHRNEPNPCPAPPPTSGSTPPS